MNFFQSSQRCVIALGLLGGLLLLFAGSVGRFVVVMPILLLGPGYLLEHALKLQLAPLVRPALWLGASLACIPVYYLWATIAGLALHTPWLWLYVLLISAMLAWVWWQAPAPSMRFLAFSGLSPQSAVLVGIIILATIWTRIEQIRGLAAPLWVDSVHHALITRVVAETGQVPFSLQPYLPVDHFVYHWGYHALAATMMQLTGLSLPTTMLWLGQVLSFAYIFALGGCAIAWWKHPLAWIISALMVGFISVMPAYYLSWGRYTLLAGALVVPAVLVLSWYGFHVTHSRWAWLLTLLVAGALMIHIVAGTVAILWCVALWLCFMPITTARLKRTAVLAAAGLGALVLAGPWLATLLTRVSQPTGGATRLVTNGPYNAYAAAEGLFWTGTNIELMVVAALAAVLCLWRRIPISTPLIVWCGLVMLLANPVWLGASYIGFFNNNIVALMIFLPIILFVAGGAVVLDELISTTLAHPHRIRRWRVARTVLVAGLLLIHFDDMRHITNDQLIIVRESDLEALEWAQNHLPPDARVAINTDPWLYDVSRGVDGGWWLLPMSGHHVSTPPVIFTYGSRDYYDLVTAETSWLREQEPRSPEEIARWLHDHHYTHVYATPQGHQFIIQYLADSPLFTPVYQNSAVSIFALNPAPSSSP